MLGLWRSDAVVCPSFTLAATAEIVASLGATAIFVDIDEANNNLDPEALEPALETARRSGLKPRAIIAVDLFGLPADYGRIEPFCKAHNLVLIADLAQGFGGSYKGRTAGSIGDFATTSFYPAKPLGAYGDGGALFTANDAHAAVIRSLHVHGQGADKYDNVRIGVNSRLDTVQASIPLQQLAIFADEITARQNVANRYHAGLADIVVTPSVLEGCVSTWAQDTIRVSARQRAAFFEYLKMVGVPTAISYSIPLHL